MTNNAESIYRCTFEDTSGETVYEVVVVNPGPAEAYVLETPAGFITAFNRILVFTDLKSAYEIARKHDMLGGVIFWKGTIDSWRESSHDAGLPILLVKGDGDD